MKNLLYLGGTGLVGLGLAMVWASGVLEGRKIQEGETWKDADDSPLGPVGNVHGERDREHSPGDSA